MSTLFRPTAFSEDPKTAKSSPPARRKERRKSESLDMLFKQEARLTFLMMVIDGGSTAKKLLKTTSFRGILIVDHLFEFRFTRKTKQL